MPVQKLLRRGGYRSHADGAVTAAFNTETPRSSNKAGFVEPLCQRSGRPSLKAPVAGKRKPFQRRRTGKIRAGGTKRGSMAKDKEKADRATPALQLCGLRDISERGLEDMV